MKLIYIFPALMFSMSMLTIYVVFQMWQDPQSLEHPYFCVIVSIMAFAASLYEFHRGLAMLKDIAILKLLLKDKEDEQ